MKSPERYLANLIFAEILLAFILALIYIILSPRAFAAATTEPTVPPAAPTEAIFEYPGSVAWLPDGIVRLGDAEALSLWPAGYTAAFYEVLRKTALGIDFSGRGPERALCYVTGQGYIVYVAPDGRYQPDWYADCLPHEVGHLIDDIDGHPCGSPQFQVDVWDSITAAAEVGQGAPWPDAAWVHLVYDNIMPFPGVMKPLEAGQWGGWCELYAELFKSAADHDERGAGLLQSIPPRLRPYYEKWLPWNPIDTILDVGGWKSGHEVEP